MRAVRLWRREDRRARALRDAPPGPLRDFLAHEWPGRATPVDSLALLALDLETTGLDPQHDRILAVGFVPVDGRVIRLADAEEIIVRPDRDVGESAVLHGLTDDVVSEGESLDYALERVLAALAGRLMLVHFSMIETRFLSAACEHVYGSRLPLPAVDTLELHRRILSAESLTGDTPQGSLRLWAARDRYGLPRYPAHHAVVDALGCAELYLAQTAELGATTPLRLKHLV